MRYQVIVGQVLLKGGHKVCVIAFFEPYAVIDACVVHHPVNASPFSNHLPDGFPALLRVGKFCGYPRGPPPGFGYAT